MAYNFKSYPPTLNYSLVLLPLHRILFQGEVALLLKSVKVVLVVSIAGHNCKIQTSHCSVIGVIHSSWILFLLGE